MIELAKELIDLNLTMKLGILVADVDVQPSCQEILDVLHGAVERISQLTLENYKNETLEASRRIYRKLGKDPSRYRISSDSLYRRIIKGKGIYYVNNVVDINNIISMNTLWSVGAYDLDKIKGDVYYGVGGDEHYEGIGRGVLNIERLPVLIDDEGPFGSATSDSLRTMITGETKRVMMVIHAFGEGEGLEEALTCMESYLKQYASTKTVNIKIL